MPIIFGNPPDTTVLFTENVDCSSVFLNSMARISCELDPAFVSIRSRTSLSFTRPVRSSTRAIPSLNLASVLMRLRTFWTIDSHETFGGNS